MCYPRFVLLVDFDFFVHCKEILRVCFAVEELNNSASTGFSIYIFVGFLIFVKVSLKRDLGFLELDRIL